MQIFHRFVLKSLLWQIYAWSRFFSPFILILLFLNYRVHNNRRSNIILLPNSSDHPSKKNKMIYFCKWYTKIINHFPSLKTKVSELIPPVSIQITSFRIELLCQKVLYIRNMTRCVCIFAFKYFGICNLSYFSYNKVKQRVMKELNMSSNVSLTTDCWTNSHADSFITLTAHFINEQWQLSTLNLATGPFNERHTAENLLDFLNKELEFWQINSKTTLIVSDNASNIVSALRMSQYDNMGCNAHKLNLIVQNSFKNSHVTVLRNKVRN